MSFRKKLVSKLSRVTSSGKFIPEIDGLRFFAIITVVIYHLNTHLKRVAVIEPITSIEKGMNLVIGQGSLGVRVFFAISGFILALPFANHLLNKTPKVKLKNYYLRRVTRLEPPYIITLTAIFLLSVFFLSKDFYEELPHYLASFFYVHNIIYDSWSTINPVAWSLEIEVQFYILAPFLSYLIFRLPKNSRRTLIFVIMISSIFINIDGKHFIEDLHLRKSLITAIQYFMVGFLMADIYLTEWKSMPVGKSLTWDLLTMAAIVGLFIFSKDYSYSGNIIFLFCTTLLFIGAFQGVISNKIFTNIYLTVLGGMCYTIYLIHYAFFAVVMEYTVTIFGSNSYLLALLIQVAIVLPVLVIISSITFYLLERPFMFRNWPQMWLQYLKVKFKA